MINFYIVLFNTDKDICRLQVKLIRKYYGNDVTINLIDNSSYFKKILNFCLSKQLNCKYYFFNERQKDFSISHAKALNYVFKMILKNNERNVFILDHDLVPINSIPEKYLEQHNMLVWNYFQKLKRYRKNIGLDTEKDYYIWPGLIYLNMNMVKKYNINFEPISGKDTGWQLKKLISKKTVFFDMEEIIDNKVGSIPYELFKIRGKNLFFHMSKGSNWSRMNKYDFNKRRNNFIKKIYELMED